ncbi:LuxR C-terminal-related transcriptional regulator [Rudaea sp.]|uniref:helix-turn-helix transcriptional regulator n=1 Tax=Rudaea sp. TaxID=2136325 RepID=UPI00378521F6
MIVMKSESVGLDLELMNAVAQSQNANDLRAAAERFRSGHDFTYWIYALAGPDKALTNYPEQIVSLYLQNRWHCGSDLLIDAIHRRHRALSWELQALMETDRPLDAMQRRLMECRWDVGACFGVSAPAYSRRGNPFEYAIVSFSRKRPLSEIAKRYHEPRVQLFADYFLSVAQTIFLDDRKRAEAEPVSLTQRERDCLTWAAIGKSSWEIGRVLGISDATVNFHLGNAATKLGVHGRVSSVTQAIRLGLINPV